MNYKYTTLRTFETIVVDINTANKVFKIDPRYTLQVLKIGGNQRGNLAKFAGKTVELFLFDGIGRKPETDTFAMDGFRCNSCLNASILSLRR